MCIELTRLNKGVEHELYPSPRVLDVISQLSTGWVLSTLDANSGYWQVILEEEIQLLTTVPQGWYSQKGTPP